MSSILHGVFSAQLSSITFQHILVLVPAPVIPSQVISKPHKIQFQVKYTPLKPIMKSISILVLAAGIVAVASAAGSDQRQNQKSSLRRNLKKNIGGPVKCPAQRKHFELFDTCNLPPDMDCNYGEYECNGSVSPTEFCNCFDGRWTCAIVDFNPCNLTCPPEMPVAGASCDKDLSLQCPYGEQACPTGNVAEFNYSCENGQWIFYQPACEEPVTSP